MKKTQKTKKPKKTKTRRKNRRLPSFAQTEDEFPEVKGKTIEYLKLYLENDDTSLALAFADKTHLHLNLEPRLTVRADLSDWKTGNWRPIKSWPAQHSRSSWTEDSVPDS